MIGNKAYQKINTKLNQAFQQKKILTAVHRGSAAGNIIENTLPAYLAAIQMGADIVEADVIQSVDGQIFHFHSGMEQKNFQKKLDLRTCTAEEISKLTYLNSNFEATRYPVESLETTLRKLKDRCLINLDRAWEFFPAVCQLIEATDTVDQVLLKGPLTQATIHFFETHPTKFMFMPKIETAADFSHILELKEMNIVGVEVKATTENSYYFQRENIAAIKKHPLFVWINALSINDEKKLFAGYDDNLSILQGAEKGWGVLLDQGADVVQTDWPSLFNQYKASWLARPEQQ